MTSKGVVGTLCGCAASGGGGVGVATCFKHSPQPGPSVDYDLQLNNIFQPANPSHNTNNYFEFGSTNCVKKHFGSLSSFHNTSTPQSEGAITIGDSDVVTLDEACWVFDIAHNKVQDKYVVAAKFELTVVDAKKEKGIAIQTVLSNAQASSESSFIYLTRVCYLTGQKSGEQITWTPSKGFEFSNKNFPPNNSQDLTIVFQDNVGKMKVSGGCDASCVLGDRPKALKGFYTTKKESNIRTHLYRMSIEASDKKIKGAFFDNPLTKSDSIEVKKVYEKDKGWKTGTVTIQKDSIKLIDSFKFNWDRQMLGAFNDMSEVSNMETRS